MVEWKNILEKILKYEKYIILLILNLNENKKAYFFVVFKEKPKFVLGL